MKSNQTDRLEDAILIIVALIVLSMAVGINILMWRDILK